MIETTTLSIGTDIIEEYTITFPFVTNYNIMNNTVFAFYKTNSITGFFDINAVLIGFSVGIAVTLFIKECGRVYKKYRSR